MYPFFRFGAHAIKSFAKHKKGDSLQLNDVGEITLMANINDIDNFLELNNGRIFTLFDLGRNDFAIRTGMVSKLLKHRCGYVVAGSTIQYRKRVRLFDKVTIKTKIVAVDERWFYIDQTMWVKGQPTSHALLRTGVTDLFSGKVLPTAKVLDLLGVTDFVMPHDEWISAWAKADKLRPFPKPEKDYSKK